MLFSWSRFHTKTQDPMHWWLTSCNCKQSGTYRQWHPSADSLWYDTVEANTELGYMSAETGDMLDAFWGYRNANDWESFLLVVIFSNDSLLAETRSHQQAHYHRTSVPAFRRSMFGLTFSRTTLSCYHIYVLTLVAGVSSTIVLR